MKLTTMIVALLTFVVMTTNSFAQTAENFHKRFQIIRKADGKLIGIRDRTLPVKFSIAPYVKMVQNNLLDEQSLIVQKNGNYDQDVAGLLSDEEESFVANGGSRQEFRENTEKVITSLRELAGLNVKKIFTNPAFNEVVGGFEKKMSESLLILDPTILANVNDATFFYKRNVSYQAVSWGLDFAKKRLSEIPLLNTASFVVVEVERLIRERRNFHQNMLLHYLENFKESELGLTPTEVNLIWSSIYESRIPWYAFWESKTAVKKWDKYGVDNFYFSFRQGSTKLRTHEALYTSVGSRINYAFQEVVLNNQRVVVNLVDNESLFFRRPAIAHNFDQPSQIVRRRIMLNMAELGLSFVPVNSMIKEQVGKFIKSYYVNQKITEGALYGYFESTGDKHNMSVIKAQYLNPFDALTLN